MEHWHILFRNIPFLCQLSCTLRMIGFFKLFKQLSACIACHFMLQAFFAEQHGNIIIYDDDIPDLPVLQVQLLIGQHLGIYKLCDQVIRLLHPCIHMAESFLQT